MRFHFFSLRWINAVNQRVVCVLAHHSDYELEQLLLVVGDWGLSCFALTRWRTLLARLSLLEMKFVSIEAEQFQILPYFIIWRD